MVLVALPSGPLKRDLIQLAYEECGQAGYEFELTPEEYESALRWLNAMLSEWLDAFGVDLGYDFPVSGKGHIDDASGVPVGTQQIIGLRLALRIAPAIGKALSTESRKQMAESWSALRTKYQTTPTMQFGRNTMRGAGNRSFWSTRSPFFPVDEGYVPAIEDLS